jgi:Insulinase (Peptidase family M16)
MKNRSRSRLRLGKRESYNQSRLRVLAASLLIVLSLSPDLNLLHAASPSLADRVVERKLANGLTVLMVERHQTPVVSLNMTFGVGGVNEQVGQTGLAHLYEHMAFKGTRTVGTKNYEKERPILEELSRVGTELEQRQRELARRSLEKPASSEDRAAFRNDSRNYKNRRGSSWRAMRWPCSINATEGSGLMHRPAKI